MHPQTTAWLERAARRYRRDPAISTKAPDEIRVEAFAALADVAETNAVLLDRAHSRLSAVYATFAGGLTFAGVAIVALVVSFI